MFIRKNLKNVKIITTVSNSDSAERISDSDNEEEAAIVSKIASMIYTLPIIKSDIQDNANNITRFIVISKEIIEQKKPCRTSISIHPQIDKPGLLYEMLGYFSENNINLTKIESRPTKGKLGDYVFFIDFQGRSDDENIKTVLGSLSKVGKVINYGSYERKY